MRIRSVFQVLALSLFLLTTVGAVECDRALPIAGNTSAGKGENSTVLLDCVMSGETGLGLEAKISSSLVHSRGLIEVRFEGHDGHLVQTWKSEPFVGQFTDFEFQKVVAVPVKAERAKIIVSTEGKQLDSGGIFAANISLVAPGIIVRLEPKKLLVFSEGVVGEWQVSSAQANPPLSLQMDVRDVDGKSTYSALWRVASGSTSDFRIPPLPIGYYSVSARADIPGFTKLLLAKNFVVVAAGNPPQEPRIGLDTALSWYGGSQTDLDQAMALMRLAGVGSVRDRLSWSQVQPRLDAVEWGRYKEVAEQVASNGFELVTVFHDSPSWTRTGLPTKSGDRIPPQNMQAVQKFGQLIARGMGKYLRAVEFWNEQNSDFFSGYPYQYANAMKAFYEGVKSVDPSLPVLIGAAAARPGQFFEESYRNDLATHFDVRNQHYYGAIDEFSQFFATHVLPVEQGGGVDKKPGWLTEIGYSLRRDNHGSVDKVEREQAVYLTKAYAEGFAAGYDRVFFFLLRELIEADFHNWGILRTDFSPRPAYATLAALTRHLEGREYAGVLRSASARAMFWQGKNGGYSAIAWGSGLVGDLVGSFKEIRDVFGRPLSPASPDARLSETPVLINGISSLPRGSLLPISARSAVKFVPNLRLSAGIKVDGNDVVSGSGNRWSMSVRDGAMVEVSGRVYASLGVADHKLRVSLTCESGTGVKIEGPATQMLEGDVNQGMPFRCGFRPQLASLGRSFIRVTAGTNSMTDVFHLALEPDSASLGKVAVRSLQKFSACTAWQGRASKNIALTMEPVTVPGVSCPGVKVSSRVEKSGEAWVFPALSLAGKEIDGKGLRVDVEEVVGAHFPPTPLMLQIVDASGGIWLLDMARKPASGATISYFGLLSMAKPAPWKVPKDTILNPSQAKEIMFGWGGAGGQAGQVHSYVIRAMSIIEGDSIEK